MEKNTRSEHKQSNGELLNFYLKVGLSTGQVEQLLRQQIKDQHELDALLATYEPKIKKLRKLAAKFIEKIEQKYGHLDTPDLVKRGMKFASKHGLSDAEIEAFKRLALKGDVDSQYLPFNELGYTEMSKFLGFASQPGQHLNLKATDHAPLNEIAKLYEANKLLHSAVRGKFVMYRSCAPEAISGTFDPSKQNPNLFIHPLIVALFLPKISELERRMLLSNIGRLVVQRTQMYFQLQSDSARQLQKFANWNTSMNDLLPGELEADLELSYDIARDPNSLNYFSDESPMSNLLKRYKIQIELWKNVLSLRSGKFYSQGESFTPEDSIVGLQGVLSSYDWTYFDSPDNAQMQDEGTMLRKLLAAFSVRPTFTQISSLVHRTGLGYSNLGAVSRATFINTPICNIKLPVNIYGGGAPAPAVRLETALTQSDWFIENKMLVPKNKTVIHSRKLLFFYVNRRQQTVNFASTDVSFRYIALPGTVSHMSTINTTPLAFTNELAIGSDRFTIQSVVVANKLMNGQLSTGCSAMIRCNKDASVGRTHVSHYYYNPLAVSVMFRRGDSYVRNDPVSPIYENSSDPQTPGFVETARQYGTVFVYVNLATN